MAVELKLMDPEARMAVDPRKGGTFLLLLAGQNMEEAMKVWDSMTDEEKFVAGDVAIIGVNFGAVVQEILGPVVFSSIANRAQREAEEFMAEVAATYEGGPQ